MGSLQKENGRWLEIGAFLFFTLLMALKAQAATPILVLGDSRIKAPVGIRLDSKLRAMSGAQVTTYGVCQSTPGAWMSGTATSCGYSRKDPAGKLEEFHSGSAPMVVTLLATVKPRHTVVLTGETNLKDSPGKIQSDFRSLVRAVRASGSTCVWMGPELGSKGSTAYYAAIREVEDVECAVVDIPAIVEVDGSIDLSDFIAEMVNFGELDPE